jgi:hypothetical protein
MLTEMMMNQMNHLIHLSVGSRKMVRAKDVLLHVVPRMVQKPAGYESKLMLGIFVQSMSSQCMPRPYLVAADSNAEEIKRVSLFATGPCQRDLGTDDRTFVLAYPAGNQKMVVPPEWPAS